MNSSANFTPEEKAAIFIQKYIRGFLARKIYVQLLRFKFEQVCVLISLYACMIFSRVSKNCVFKLCWISIFFLGHQSMTAFKLFKRNSTPFVSLFGGNYPHIQSCSVNLLHLREFCVGERKCFQI